MKHTLSFLALWLTALIFSACGYEHEPFDTPYLHFLLDDGTSSAVVTSDVKAINSYYVYLSSPSLKEKLTVEYEVVVGNGLSEGIDYELLSAERHLTFLPGVCDMPIRIRWIPNPTDPHNDNTLTIRLLSNDQGITMGMPGPDEKMRELKITKQ